MRETPINRPKSLRFTIFATILGLIVAATVLVASDYFSAGLPQGSIATYVGRDRCIDCHRDQAKLYEGSQHDLAMQVANRDTVLGDFSGAEIEHYGVRSRMFTKDNQFFVNTEGPDGKSVDFKVKYVFGVEPLQQYMVEFDRAENQPATEEARIQVLRVSWDTEKKQWFYLDPPDVHERLAPDDDLHWTGVAQRWNNMCADCHSTNLKKNYVANDKTYHTTFSEIDVSCESCHGPGSEHVALASRWSFFWDRKKGYALADLKSNSDSEIQTCAPCHSRRQRIFPDHDPTKPYFDHYKDDLLTEGLFYADGQVLDEDYIHASFLQSKMYHRGIKCSDCHDPHTAKLKHSGNEVCTSCHQHPSAKYDSPAHHFHKPGTAGSNCVDCHMMSTTYMAVDPRRDHSFRIPRPDLSDRLESPNACTSCHLAQGKLSEEKRSKMPLYQDWMAAAVSGDQEVRDALQRANQWCDEACERWYGERRRKDRHFGEALAAVRKRAPDAVAQLRWLLDGKGPEAPAIARATALQEATRLGPDTAAQLARGSLDDSHPLVRAAAASAHEGLGDAEANRRRLEPLLDDPIRIVRTEAARVLVSNGVMNLNAGKDRQWLAAIDELCKGIDEDADRATAHLAIGSIDMQFGRLDEAERRFRLALKTEPNNVGPRGNLASLLESKASPPNQPDPKQAEAWLSEAKSLRQEELKFIRRDANLLPNQPSIQYRAGLALYLAGELAEATSRLERALQLDPSNSQFLLAITLIYEKQQLIDKAIASAERLVAVSPRAEHREILNRLRIAKNNPQVTNQ